MKGLRFTLTSILAVGLLAGSAVAVAAQDGEAAAEPPTTVEVTGSIDLRGNDLNYRIEEVTWNDERNVEERRGRYLDSPIEMDELRLSGQLRATVNLDSYGGPEGGGDLVVATARTELVNDDGTWTGTLRGYRDVHTAPDGFPQRDIHWHIELSGTGVYDGHTALLYAHGDPNRGGTLAVEGFMFRGVLPEYPDSVEVPAFQ